jgi:GNAT superfamily N-acetyltransferase
MSGKIKVDIMASCDADEAVGLWENQFAYFCKDKAIYPCWENNTDSIANYITGKSNSGYAFVARGAGRPLGFISFDIFDFHGALSAICHFCGNAAAIADRQAVYLSLYQEMCRYCAERGVLTHYISISYNDADVKNVLFDLGFGAYGIDAYASFDKPLSLSSPFGIGLATAEDAQAVAELRAEAADYFLRAPICLQLEPCPLELIEQKIASGAIYAAKDKGVVVGIMDVEVAPEDNIYRLYTKGCGVVCGEVGAYIKEEYRGRGIGSCFIETISDYCVRNRLHCAHVPWETSNPYANRFWRKFFSPTVLGLKRTLHPDSLR